MPAARIEGQPSCRRGPARSRNVDRQVCTVDPRSIPPELATALATFEKNLAEPVTPARLARRAGLTPAKFARLIHRFFDLTLIQVWLSNEDQLCRTAPDRGDLPAGRQVEKILRHCGLWAEAPARSPPA
ncbi:MAG: hypothetical protein FJ280_29320 [Planctomycetes bacterium]|nr:hypothetical protein [Planctomycetota bacterium]